MDLFKHASAKSYGALLYPSEEQLVAIRESYENGESYDSDDE